MRDDFDILSGFNNIDILKNAPEQKEKKDYKDPRFWKISKDKEGNGSAVIRLLTDKNKIPYVRLYHYSSKKTINKKDFFLIVNSPDSIGLPCPIKEHYFELVNQGLKDEAKNYSRKVKYYTNIYVEKDPANPENEGKVFLWEFGQKMLDKFVAWMNEEDVDMGVKPKNLFNPLIGNSIKLVINYNPTTKFYEYDRTMVAPSETSVGGIKDKNKIVDILLNQTYDLNEFKSPEYFESYEDIKERLIYFINPFKKDSDKREETALNIEDDYTPAIKENQQNTSAQDTKQDDEMPDWVSGNVSTEKEAKKEETKPSNFGASSTSEKNEEDWIQDFDDLFK